jgi:hypothetical protein
MAPVVSAETVGATESRAGARRPFRRTARGGAEHAARDSPGQGGAGRGMSDSYGVKDTACPISTG